MKMKFKNLKKDFNKFFITALIRKADFFSFNLGMEKFLVSAMVNLLL